MQKLRAKVEARVPVFIASAGSGLVAQLLEKAGVDCVNTFSGARLRANGMGTMSMLWPILDSNKQTLDYTEQDIVPAMKGDAFVCACLNANDPLKDMRSVLERLKAMGVMSASNIGPSISYVDKDSNLFRVLTSAGITLQHEIDLLKLTRELDMVSVGLAFDEEDSLRVVAEAQPDIFCFHAGKTKGGLKGFDSGETIEETDERSDPPICTRHFSDPLSTYDSSRASSIHGTAANAAVNASASDVVSGPAPSWRVRRSEENGWFSRQRFSARFTSRQSAPRSSRD